MNNSLNVALGTTIFRLRQISNRSQSEIAQQLGVSQATISYIEHGAKTNSLELLNKISACFGLKTSDLLAMAENAVSDRFEEVLAEILEDTLNDPEGWTPLEEVSPREPLANHG